MLVAQNHQALKEKAQPTRPWLHAEQRAASTNTTAALAAEMLPEKASVIQAHC